MKKIITTIILLIFTSFCTYLFEKNKYEEKLRLQKEVDAVNCELIVREKIRSFKKNIGWDKIEEKCISQCTYFDGRFQITPTDCFDECILKITK